MSDLISRADAIEVVMEYFPEIRTREQAVYVFEGVPSADAVSDAYKRGFDDCKRAYEIELARSDDAKAHEEEHLKIIKRIKELQYEIAKTQTVVSKMAKSADAVQGEWTHDGSMWENRWVCDKCGHKIFERQTNFCPNCGAIMKGGDELCRQKTEK